MEAFSVRMVAKTVANIPDVFGEQDMSGDDFVAYAARVSNPSNQMNTETYSKLLNYLRDKHHWSPFEMAHAVIEIKCTRDIGRQILRHRSFSFQEFSQRYAEATEFYTEFPARRQDLKNRQNSIDDMDEATQKWWLDAQLNVATVANNNYRAALERGIAKEIARKVLPEGLTMTTFYMAGTLRSWIHYTTERIKPGVQKEHQDIALAILAVMCREFPNIFLER